MAIGFRESKSESRPPISQILITEKVASERKDLTDHVGKLATVIALRIARTVPSPDPAYNGAHVPLLSTYLLNDKSDRRLGFTQQSTKQQEPTSLKLKWGSCRNHQRKRCPLGSKCSRAISLSPQWPAHTCRLRQRVWLIWENWIQLVAIVASVDGNRVYLNPDAIENIEVEDSDFLSDLALPRDIRVFQPSNLWIQNIRFSILAPAKGCNKLLCNPSRRR